jgi:hypothetical protein
MSTINVVGIVIAAVIVVVVAVTTLRIMATRRELRDRYGPEYQRLIDEKGGRAAAEAELRRRERRHAELQLRDLPEEERAAYREKWLAVQALFVEDPVAAVRDADKLVAAYVADRGYPAVEFQERLAHLSVEHAGVLDRYRDAHEVSVRNDAGRATTEELRQALMHYRELFGELFGERVGDAGPVDVSAPAEKTGPTANSEPAEGAVLPGEGATMEDTAPVTDTPSSRPHDAARDSSRAAAGTRRPK